MAENEIADLSLAGLIWSTECPQVDIKTYGAKRKLSKFTYCSKTSRPLYRTIQVYLV